MPTRNPSLLVSLLILLGADFSLAQERAVPPPRTIPMARPGAPPSILLSMENDNVAGTDRYYSNGLRLAYMGRGVGRAQLTPFSEKLAALGWDSTNPQWTYSSGLALEHFIFTPDDTTRSAAIPHDQPYAGYLGLDFTFAAQTPRRLRSFVFSLGVVGPAALGEEVQNGFHKMRDREESMGWGNQLENELVLNLHYMEKFRFLHTFGSSRWAADFLPYLSVSAGNRFTGAQLGFHARFGWGLPDDFETNQISPHAFVHRNDSTPRRLGVHVLVGAEGKGSVHDIFLDGNTFKDSQNVDKRPLVGQAKAGLGVTWGRCDLTAAFIWSTEEFEGQKGNHRFGFVSLAYRF